MLADFSFMSCQIIETLSAVDHDEPENGHHFLFSLTAEAAGNLNFTLKDNKGRVCLWRSTLNHEKSSDIVVRSGQSPSIFFQLSGSGHSGSKFSRAQQKSFSPATCSIFFWGIPRCSQDRWAIGSLHQVLCLPRGLLPGGHTRNPSKGRWPGGS